MIKLIFIPMIMLMLIGVALATKLFFTFKEIKNITKNKYAKSLAYILSMNSLLMVFAGIVMCGGTLKRLIEYPSDLQLSVIMPMHLAVTILFVLSQGALYWLVEKKELN